MESGMTDNPKKGMSARTYKALAIDRSRKAWQMHQDGMTYAEVARALGHMSDPDKPLTREAARGLVSRYARHLKAQKLREEKGLPEDISARTARVLMHYDYSVPAIQNAISSGRLLAWPNVGRSTLKQIREWMGSEHYDAAEGAFKERRAKHRPT